MTRAVSSIPAVLQRDQRAKRLRSPKLQHLRERFINGGLALSAVISIGITLAIIFVLGTETLTFFTGYTLHGDQVLTHDAGVESYRPVGLSEFFGTLQWRPLMRDEYGIWPIISGTLLVASIAMILALPLGLVTAIYLSEYAPSTVRSFLKPTLEILAGIPTVVYGFFAVVFLTPGLQWVHNIFTGEDGFFTFNALSAGLAVGVLCLPIVSSLCEDALQAVPRSLREGSYGLGGTKFDTSVKVVVPAALSGIVSAFLLAIARAIGETMIVALAAGATATLTADPRHEIQTITGYMVQVVQGDVSNFDARFYSLYAVGGVLFVMTLALTIVGNLIRKRFREEYQ